MAERLLPNGAPFLNAVTFHCQQSADKYIKPLLMHSAIDFPKTHDLMELLVRNAVLPLIVDTQS